MMKRLIFIIVCFGAVFGIHSQDTISFETPTPRHVLNKDNYIAPTSVGVGLSLLSGIDVAGRGDWECINPQPDKNNLVVDVSQYVPVMLPWVMKIAGNPTRSGWGQMAVSHALGIGLMAGSVKLLKDATEELRPDGSNLASFPSGHSAWAFLGATMISRELGWRSSWYSFGAYTFATGVAVERVLSKRHFPADVVAGAGIGVLMGELGYLFGDLIWGKNRIENEWTGVYCNDNKINISLESEMIFSLGDINLIDGYIRHGVGLETAISAGIPVVDDFGIDLKLGLRTTPVFYTDEFDTKMYVAPYNRIGLILYPYYRKPLADRFGVSVKIGGGYYKNMTLQSVADAISVGSGGFVGKIKIGADISIYENMLLGVDFGYDVSEYEYVLSENETMNILKSMQKTGTLSGLSVGVSMKMNF